MKIDFVRTLTHKAPSGEQSAVTVRFGPAEELSPNRVRLRLRIKGPVSRPLDIHIEGVDAVQALILAIRAARSALEVEPAAKEGRLYFVEPSLGIGFSWSEGM